LLPKLILCVFYIFLLSLLCYWVNWWGRRRLIESYIENVKLAVIVCLYHNYIFCIERPNRISMNFNLNLNLEENAYCHCLYQFSFGSWWTIWNVLITYIKPKIRSYYSCFMHRFWAYFIFKLWSSSHWRWRQHGPPKHWYPTTSLCITTQKTTTWNVIVGNPKSDISF
jgi:hypothetical protein